MAKKKKNVYIMCIKKLYIVYSDMMAKKLNTYTIRNKYLKLQKTKQQNDTLELFNEKKIIK